MDTVGSVFSCRLDSQLIALILWLMMIKIHYIKCHWSPSCDGLALRSSSKWICFRKSTNNRRNLPTNQCPIISKTILFSLERDVFYEINRMNGSKIETVKPKEWQFAPFLQIVVLTGFVSRSTLLPKIISNIYIQILICCAFSFLL